MPILLPDGRLREDLMEWLKAKGIQTSIHYPPVHQFSAYSKLTADVSTVLKVTESLAAREVTLPLYPALSAADVTFVVETLRDALSGISEC
jgi:dTDP-4-amino-4,6-dideoxygalactose transaminase